MKIHRLKTDPDVFDDLMCKAKTFELRFNDRDFQLGDTLTLRETRHSGEEMKNGAPLIYTGFYINARVTHMIRGPRLGLMKGWVIMSIEFEKEQPGLEPINEGS